jgi:flagellin-like hook-associated protein FlgL
MSAWGRSRKCGICLVQSDVATGSKIGFLNTLKRNLENMEFDTMDQTTRLQEADIAQIAIDLSRREVLYQMSLSVVGRLMSMSLLDFIR